ncbi:hypothetical protein M2152_001563 [Microbacteriaceae bacterium SG_E_30_P1]|uniref:Lipoprotein n=1 Tax=Antiquaquibacter oligotrophicus TaxID=2880260 RepID=A0ABT6KN02_9MICO|nr:hypothetical protein [Antiquaquibacter oligotrophicus]MDH6181381.1 hypothetical protein [Antiquaquibacter oligotrophicus]UDF12926.1 hypothetical protein LH407_12300 [Antiquaquibacter oligotrophicus]
MRLLAALALAVLAATLSGCGPGRVTDAPAPEPTVTEEPLFATDAEALAAAEKVYREYSDLADAAGASADPSALTSYVTEEWFAREEAGYRDLAESGKRLVGTTILTSFRLQSFDGHEIVVYVCHDTRAVRVIEQETLADVTPTDRPNEALLEVRFEVEEGLRIAESNLWSNSCS